MARTRVLSTPLVLGAVVLALGSCSGPTPAANGVRRPSSPTPVRTDVAQDEKGPPSPPTRERIAVPTWAACTSGIGGLPVPNGWKLVSHRRNGYQWEEEYEAPPGVEDGQILAWYRARIPHDDPWGGWQACFPAGNGAGSGYDGKPSWWAWHHPTNPAHVIQLSVGGVSTSRRGIWLSRDDGGDCL